MKKILCIGSITYDITIPFDGFPMENTKNRVNNLLECGGGSASNAAYLLGKWGMKPYFAGALGNDTYGYKIFEEFKSAEVNCKYIEVDNQYETPVSIVIVNTNFGSRTVLSNHNPDLKIKRKKDIKADVILIDGQEYDASIRALNSNPKAISIIDAGRLTDNIVDLAKRVNYLVCSKNFAEDFTGIAFDFDQPATMIQIFDKMEETFKNTIIITLESRGSLYKENGKIKIMPSIKVKAVDTTGAGDFFHGAFAYCIANDFDIVKTLRIANITGALSVTKMGSRNSVYSLEEVMKTYEENV